VQQVLEQTFTVGTLPAAAGSFDREIWFGTFLPVVDWKTGQSESGSAVVRVSTRPSVLYGHLFAALGSFIEGVTYILVGVAVFFGIIELIALIIGTRMTRTVTAAVADLHVATRHVDRGDFSHRIPVKSSDQLADLAHSFNSMTASIEKLIQGSAGTVIPAADNGTGVTRGSRILPPCPHRERRLLRLSRRKLAQADRCRG
jgi:phosphoserine phosphatase RsbU/P